MKDNYLNIFRKEDYCPWRWLPNWPKNIKHFFCCFKYAYQRATKGFSDWDRWDLDVFYNHLFVNSLREYAEKAMGYPGNDEFPTMESWQKYLNDMADLFEQSIEGYETAKNPYEKEFEDTFMDRSQPDWFERVNKPTPEEQKISKKYFKAEQKLAEYRDKCHHKAMKMLEHVFGSLWD